jgi:hypothetical protein
MSAYAVTKWIYISLSYEFCEPIYRPITPANRWLLWSDLQLEQTQNSASGKAARWALYPRFSCSYQVSGTQYIHNSDKGKWLKGVWLVVLCFPNFSKARKLNSHKWSAFKLLCHNVVEGIFSCIEFVYSCM